MKLYSVAQRGNQFKAGLIDGTITFKADSMSLSGVNFIPYADVSSKKQIKDLSDFIPLFSWMKQELLKLTGGELPYNKEGIRSDEFAYDPDAISHAILGIIGVDRLWINKRSILIC